MAFFARPNLDNTQFKQLVGSELTLSGQTQIATTSGLTLIGDGGMYIPIIATGASNNFVLTYDSTQQAIILKQSSASGGSTVYTYTGDTTCAVGGLPIGQNLFNDPLVDIIHCMVSPTLNPTLSNPTISSFTLSPTTTVYEVGSCPSICGTTVFNAGSISPQYTSASSCRSDGTICYVYNAFGFPICTVGNFPTDTNKAFGFNTVGAGTNTISAKVCYCGGTQPYDSSGAAYCSPLAIGSTATCSKTLCGVYPWYWGIESSGGAASGVNRPTACCIKDVITGGTANKVVAASTATICATFGSTGDDYIWFATPVGSTTKTCWYVNALNSGSIGGVVSAGGNLFPAPENVTGITTTCWSGQEYKIYVSNYQSCATSSIQLRNS